MPMQNENDTMGTNNKRIEATTPDSEVRTAIPKWFLTIAFLSLVLWSINLIVGGSSWSERGVFGDTFGAVNSLFSAFAFIGIAYSISLQRDEARASNKERIAAQNDAQYHRENSSLQRFETTFFQMFTAFNSAVDDIEKQVVEYVDPETNAPTDVHSAPPVKVNKTYKGRDCFPIILKRFLGIYGRDGVRMSFDDIPKATDRDYTRFNQAYYELLNTEKDSVRRYLRSVAIIIMFIERADIADAEKLFYFNFFRSQLTKDESTLLAVHYASNSMESQVRPAFKKYAMAENAYRHHGALVGVPPSEKDIFGDRDLKGYQD